MSPIIFDYIGFYGPMILILVSIFSLWKRKYYVYSYLFFYMINIFLNKILKKLVREPRPNNSIDFRDIIFDYFDKYKEEEQFGMPSGHAQMIFYSISFLYLVTKSPILLFISLFIGVLTLYQRWKYRNHTIYQLFIGSLIGLIFGSSVYYSTNQYLHSY